MNRIKYELSPNPVPTISWIEYCLAIEDEFQKLLDTYPNNESKFQDFFERNPCYLPGAFELRDLSGHGPHLNCLISQPSIGSECVRKPDFLWLAQDSLTFCPVFIEIEKPSKKTFTISRNTSSDFSQAMDQIREWKALLNKPHNRTTFYESYNLPKTVIDKSFSPQYILIYGRRNEYENDVFLSNKRAELQSNDTLIMSYDRLKPRYDSQNMVCVNVTNKTGTTKYNVKRIPPVFRLDARKSSDYPEWNNFIEAVDTMELTSAERKKFLKERFRYWKEIGPTLHSFSGYTEE